MTQHITIVDYGIGNLCSIQSALSFLGYNSKLSSCPAEVEKSDVLILPGVGSFRKAMLALQNAKLDQALLQAVFGRDRKILGICLGMQMLALHSSEDGETAGLGFISAKVERFNADLQTEIKIPHIGFNQVFSADQSILFKGINQSSDFYFVHSYRILADKLKGQHAICHYGQDFVAAYEHENIFATQFHPEKSQTNGLKLLKNFLKY